MKELTGSASGTTPATPGQAMALFEDIDHYPIWDPELVKEAGVLERDAQGHPTKARCRLHIERGPLTRDFNLIMSVRVGPAGTMKLSRIPHESSDAERFEVTWRVDGGPSTRLRVDLAANLSVPKLVPLGGIGDSLAQNLLSAAMRALASP